MKAAWRAISANFSFGTRITRVFDLSFSSFEPEDEKESLRRLQERLEEESESEESEESESEESEEEYRLREYRLRELMS